MGDAQRALARNDDSPALPMHPRPENALAKVRRAARKLEVSVPPTRPPLLKRVTPVFVGLAIMAAAVWTPLASVRDVALAGIFLGGLVLLSGLFSAAGQRSPGSYLLLHADAPFRLRSEESGSEEIQGALGEILGVHLGEGDEDGKLFIAMEGAVHTILANGSHEERLWLADELRAFLREYA